MVGEGVGGNQFSTFDAETKLAKIPNSHGGGGGGRGWGLVETNFQLLMLSPNLLKSQIPMSVCVCGGGGGRVKGVGGNQFLLLVLSPNLLKSQIPMPHGGGGGGGGMSVETNFQLLILNPNLLKSKNIFTREFTEHFLSFRAKKCQRMVLDFEYQVVRVYANHNE